MTRLLRRGAAVLGTSTVLVLLPAASALAVTRDDGDDPGGLTVFQTLGLYVGIPLLLLAAIALLVYVPSLAQGPRYRPGWAWWHDAVWFSGPRGDQMAYADAAAGREPGPATVEGGGASARW